VRSDLIEENGLVDDVRIDPVGTKSFKGFDHRFRIAEVIFECNE